MKLSSKPTWIKSLNANLTMCLGASFGMLQLPPFHEYAFFYSNPRLCYNINKSGILPGLHQSTREFDIDIFVTGTNLPLCLGKKFLDHLHHVIVKAGNRISHKAGILHLTTDA